MAFHITSLTIAYSSVFFRRRSKKIWKLRVTGLCAGNSPVTGEFPAQRASNAENVSISITSSWSSLNLIFIRMITSRINIISFECFISDGITIVNSACKMLHDRGRLVSFHGFRLCASVWILETSLKFQNNVCNSGRKIFFPVCIWQRSI